MHANGWTYSFDVIYCQSYGSFMLFQHLINFPSCSVVKEEEMMIGNNSDSTKTYFKWDGSFLSSIFGWTSPGETSSIFVSFSSVSASFPIVKLSLLVVPYLAKHLSNELEINWSSLYSSSRSSIKSICKQEVNDSSSWKF